MTDKKLTDEEILKGLEEEIHLAEYVDSDYCCNTEVSLLKSTLDLINRQKAEIERLRAKVETRTQEKLALGRIYTQKLKTVKYEAYKEFAKGLNEEIEKAYNNNSGVLREHLGKHKEKPNFEFVAAIQGKMNTLRGLDDFIDNLLKELVSEEE